MEITSVLGFLFGFFCIGFGYMMDGGVLAALWMLSAFIITVGGSIGALLVSVGGRELSKLPGMMLEVFLKPKSTIGAKIEYLVQLNVKARQAGLLSLEKEITAAGDGVDPFIRRGILMALDGTDAEKISEVLNNDIYIRETDRANSITMFDSFGAFAPAFGMVGTIAGLIIVMQAGMESPDQVTKAIGVAFITTLYGVVMANMFFLPASGKLRARMAYQRMEWEMIIEAVCAIRNGISPRLLQEQLETYYLLEGGKRSRGREKKQPLRGVKGGKAA